MGLRRKERLLLIAQMKLPNLDELTIINYPDPRLRERCAPVTEFNGELEALARRMLELMRERRGVGLAAAQVGVPLRLFVMNMTGQPDGDRAYVNPEIRDAVQMREAEEGCLSIPEVTVTVRRAHSCRLVARTLSGEPVELEGEGLQARVWQHETDHLDGVLILDRMGPGDALATRRALRELEDVYARRKRGKAGTGK